MSSLWSPPCETRGCQWLAIFEVFWPGQTLKMCATCADRARGVAAAMGLPLTVRELAGASVRRPAARTVPNPGPS